MLTALSRSRDVIPSTVEHSVRREYPVSRRRCSCYCEDYQLCPNCVALQSWESSPSGHRDTHSLIQLTEILDVRVGDIRAMRGAIHHYVDCNNCHRPIRGVRYKCIQCGNLDLCPSCISRQGEIDEPSHTFVTFVQRGKLIYRPTIPITNYRIESSSALPLQDAPLLGRVPNTTGNSPVTSERTREGVCGDCGVVLNTPDLSVLTAPVHFQLCPACVGRVTERHPGHSFIRCSNSSDVIVGPIPTAPVIHRNNCVRSMYRCLHPACESTTLCEQCESLPNEVGVHPLSHPLVKFRQDHSQDERRREVWDKIFDFSRSLRNCTSGLEESTSLNVHYVPNECPICYEDMTGRMTTGAPCGHLLCRDCRALILRFAREEGRRASCHFCRSYYESDV
ncbi:uncharacterized protein EI90DRAFT_3043149 [Cantharellus anzutake]|uniref:uncharacterized protein n=1 Tax=Cantharellus anzutake TaxID=1750568 RepID=UPI0019075862|nr:uncharacterized protein EI90DRAFT_3043149 [Cantharellus anzutake]KAF8337488.1 hypothetical protein EI90DRAFT_3043149 [Cantharellus anzutake]